MPQLVWLVTGCSSGLGEHFVESILARGDLVIATARNDLTRLNHLKELGAKVLQLDVTSPPDEIDAAVNKALKIYGGVDVLVNNAGYLGPGFFETTSHAKFMEQFQTNVFGAANVTRAILPHFRQKRAGIIAFLGSIGGWTGFTGASAYCGSKFAIEGMSESIRNETSHLGIQTVVFELGYFKTKIFHTDNMKWSIGDVSEYKEMEESVQSDLVAANGNQRGDAKTAVEVMVDVVKCEGVAKGRSIPDRLPLGPDAIEIIRGKCQATLDICKEWESVIISTDSKE